MWLPCTGSKVSLGRGAEIGHKRSGRSMDSTFSAASWRLGDGGASMAEKVHLDPDSTACPATTQRRGQTGPSIAQEAHSPRVPSRDLLPGGPLAQEKRVKRAAGMRGGASGEEPARRAGDTGDAGSIPESGRSPGGGHGNPLRYSCLENPHGQRSLVGCSPWGHEELDTTEATYHARIQETD